MSTIGSAVTSPSDSMGFLQALSLENGDHLTREEFERRYQLRPDIKKAELIEGIVYMPSPVRVEAHSTPHAAMLAWLGYYWAFTPGVQAADNGSVRLDDQNEPQPDGFLFIKPENGGRVRINADDYVEGAPEWMGEVSASTKSIDLNAKFRAYCRNQVQEYMVWRVLERAIDWFVLRSSQFERMLPDENGWYRSQVFPGLWLASEAIINLDVAAVLKALDQGIASPEHAVFVAQLATRQAAT